MSGFCHLQCGFHDAGGGDFTLCGGAGIGEAGREGLACRGLKQRSLGCDGLWGCAGAHFPDRVARFLQIG